jgi:hypothetical protein
MSMKSVRCVVLGAVLFAAAVSGCGESSEKSSRVVSLEARVKALEIANAALEKEAASKKVEAPVATADGGAQADCAAALEACLDRVTKCEKDPFTGSKYLADPPAAR